MQSGNPLGNSAISKRLIVSAISMRFSWMSTALRIPRLPFPNSSEGVAQHFLGILQHGRLSHLRGRCGYLLAVVLVGLLHADDWPQWRGPHRDGIWRETGVLDRFPPQGLRICWRTPVGPGYSGVVVAQGRVYVCDCQLKPESIERMHCFEASTGKLLWSFSYPCSYDGLYYGAGPYATPIVQNGKVYMSGPKGHLHCLDAGTGKVLWKHDRMAEYPAILPQCGCNSSPIIEGNLLIVMGGGRAEGCVIAYDTDTGQEVWSALKDRPGGSSPIGINAGGRRQLVVWTLDSVSSLDPATGKVYWQIPTKAMNDGGALTTPVVYKDLALFICEKALLIKLDPEKTQGALLSQTARRKSVNTFVSPVFLDEHYYYSAVNDTLGCFEVVTGNQLWTAKGVSAGNGNAMFQMTPHEQAVFIFTDGGQLLLAHLAPSGYTELDRATLLEPTKGTWTPISGKPKTWAQPAYANRHIFARSDEELVCASLEADVPQKGNE